MNSRLNSFRGNLHKSWRPYFVKAALLVAVLLLLGKFMPVMPGTLVAVCWAALSLLATMGVMYQVVLRKVHRSMKFSQPGVIGSVNKGRVFYLIGSYLLSAVCVAGLLLEAPRWDVWVWALVLFCLLFFPVAHRVVSHFVEREYEPLFRKGASVLGACALTTLVALLLYAAVVCVQPAASYGSVLQAFTSTSDHFAGSPSALLREVGVFAWISDSSINYGLAVFHGLAESSVQVLIAYIVVRIVLVAAAFLGIVNLFAVCAFTRKELLSPFMSLEAIKEDKKYKHLRPNFGYVVTACALPALLVAAFIYADVRASTATQTQEYNWAQGIAREVAGQTVYDMDGAYYDREQIDSLLNDVDRNNITGELGPLGKSAEDLRSSLGRFFNDPSAKVNSYLDWYFELSGDAESLASMRSSSVEEVLSSRFVSDALGDDAVDLENALQAYIEQASSCKNQIEGRLSSCKVEVPEDKQWLLDAKEIASDNRLKTVYGKAREMLDAAEQANGGSLQGSGKALLEHRIKTAVLNSSEFESMKQFAQKLCDSSSGFLSVPANSIEAFGNSLVNRDGYRSGLQECLNHCKEDIEGLILES